MRRHSTTTTSYLRLCISFFIGISCLCAVIYYLVSDVTNNSRDLQLFAYQLITLSLGSTLIFSIIAWFYLPTRIQQQLPAPAQSAIEKSNTQSKTIEKSHADQAIHILIVDDNKTNIMVLDNYLQAPKHKIFTATNGLDAIALFEQYTIHIVLMDIEMNGMNGVQTLIHIRALEETRNQSLAAQKSQRTPVIAVSAHDQGDKKLTMLTQGFDDYLAKPVDQTVLLDTIQRWKVTLNDQSESQNDNIAIPTYRSSIQQRKKTKTSDSLQKTIDIKASLRHSNYNNQLAKDMLSLLITMVRDEKENLLYYYESQHWEKLYQLNHKIYGGSSYCGVPQLQAANKKLEMLLQQTLSFHEPAIAQTEQKTTQEIPEEYSKPADIDKAIMAVCDAIDDILKWDKEYDIDIIFDIS